MESKWKNEENNAKTQTKRIHLCKLGLDFSSEERKNKVEVKTGVADESRCISLYLDLYFLLTFFFFFFIIFLCFHS